MEPTARACLALPLLLLAVAAPASGQVLAGVLQDADRGRPVPGATLRLMDSAYVAVDSTHSDARGRFRLTAPAAGAYSVGFQLDGYAGHSSETVRLGPGAATQEFVYRVPLVTSAALGEMSDIMSMEPRLQQALPEICGGAFRPWEAGLLVGRVRQRAGNAPVAGARVAVADGALDDAGRSTVSNEHGVYVLCNVPAGTAIRITAQPADGAAEVTEVEIRAGSASWYDLLVGPRRR